MLLLNKTLMKLARGSWPWILAIAGVGFLTLMGITALAEIIAGFLGDLFQPQTALLLAVALVLFPVNDLFRRRIEEIREGYWKSLDDMTGYYMDCLRGLTTLKLFDRDREHSRILGGKGRHSQSKHQPVHEDQFHLLFGDRADDLWGHRGRAGRFRPGDRPGDITIAQGLVVLMLAYSYFSSWCARGC